uniref:Uncharacterized protein n=1 Tax=Panagrolaimus superbus TaxID=310955 RepID=A0A914YBD7_9BILA
MPWRSAICRVWVLHTGHSIGVAPVGLASTGLPARARLHAAQHTAASPRRKYVHDSAAPPACRRTPVAGPAGRWPGPEPARYRRSRRDSDSCPARALRRQPAGQRTGRAGGTAAGRAAAAPRHGSVGQPRAVRQRLGRTVVGAAGQPALLAGTGAARYSEHGADRAGCHDAGRAVPAGRGSAVPWPGFRAAGEDRARSVAAARAAAGTAVRHGALARLRRVRWRRHGTVHWRGDRAGRLHLRLARPPRRPHPVVWPGPACFDEPGLERVQPRRRGRTGLAGHQPAHRHRAAGGRGTGLARATSAPDTPVTPT